MKKFIAMAAASAMLLTSFAACGKDKDESSGSGFTGKWACCEMTENGQTYSVMPLFNIPLEALVQVEIKDDNTFKVSTGVIGMGDAVDNEESSEGKWEKVDDDTIKITGMSDDSDIPNDAEADFDGDTFTIKKEEDGKEECVKFKRVTEFTTYDASAMLSGLADAFGAASNDNNG